MDQGSDPGPLPAIPKGGFDLGKARYHPTGLGGDGQGLDRSSRQQGFGIGSKGFGAADAAPEASGELVTPDRFRNPFSRRGNPQAPARKLALDVGDHLA